MLSFVSGSLLDDLKADGYRAFPDASICGVGGCSSISLLHVSAEHLAGQLVAGGGATAAIYIKFHPQGPKSGFLEVVPYHEIPKASY